jgi:imidazole glycerol-phosphate synthase subunit HisH
VIALIDYGAGNLTSVRKALSALGAVFSTPSSAAAVRGARGIIVPGVGHFGATRALDDNWRTAIREAIETGASLFGICLGMQLLFDGSDEAPDVPGLGLIAGRCVRLEPASPGGDLSPPLKVPHVGWNGLDQPRSTRLMSGVAPGAQVYFTHSYIAPVVAETAAIATYSATFSAAVERDRIAGVQFHPEKSGEVGLRILQNWLHRCS